MRVDYAGLREARDWERLLRSLAEADASKLTTRDEKVAFWINAYNILAIDLVRRHYPVESIRDIGSFLRPVWDREAGVAAGRRVTLGEIEHEILRPLGEPRIHAALVCASLSCPALRREPYRTSELDTQLDEALRAWLANPRKGARFDPESGVLTVSRVFQWFAEDFESEGGVLPFLRPYLPQRIRRSLAARAEPPELHYFHYDWSLNDVNRSRASSGREGREPSGSGDVSS